jgi:hypothetical protein
MLKIEESKESRCKISRKLGRSIDAAAAPLGKIEELGLSVMLMRDCNGKFDEANPYGAAAC